MHSHENGRCCPAVATVNHFLAPDRTDVKLVSEQLVLKLVQPALKVINTPTGNSFLCPRLSVGVAMV